MNRIEKIEHWADTHHPIWIDILRIVLGILLFVKGLMFAKGQDQLLGLIGDHTTFAYAAGAIGHYIIMAHLFGGLLITIGLLSRWAAIFQLPILIGAIIFVNRQQGFYDAELWQAIIALVLCIAVVIYGSGRLSVDAFMRNHPKV